MRSDIVQSSVQRTRCGSFFLQFAGGLVKPFRRLIGSRVRRRGQVVEALVVRNEALIRCGIGVALEKMG